MSDFVLRIVPTDPEFLPKPGALLAAAQLLRTFFPLADRVRPWVYDSIGFVDPGVHWNGVRCSECGSDVSAWWAEAKAEAIAGGQRKLDVLAPCCGKPVNLNTLTYGWPVAFARCMVEAVNPQEHLLSFYEMNQLEDTLGTPLKQVQARYRRKA
jgi:hypothetical protein